MTEFKKIIKKLESMKNPENVKGMARFGISPKKTYGVSIPALRKIAKEYGKSHELAKELWSSGIHEAKILAGMFDEPKKVTKEQMNSWARDFDSWDVCDQVCMNLFDKTPFAYEKAIDWSYETDEFVKRAGFALMAVLAWHDKDASDHKFEQFLPSIVRESTDERNFVKKAVNWALRQIGKRNISLNKRAIETAKKIQNIESKSAKWIANDVLKELTSDQVKKKLGI